jgi:hypothetical protein
VTLACRDATRQALESRPPDALCAAVMIPFIVLVAVLFAGFLFAARLEG